MPVVLTVGVFDLFHYGHLLLLQRAKNLSGSNGKLIVAVQQDDVVNKYKPYSNLIYPFDIRYNIINSLKCVDMVVPYTGVDTLIEQIEFDIFAVGGDQNHQGFKKAIAYCHAHEKKVITISRTSGISTSQLKERIKKLA